MQVGMVTYRKWPDPRRKNVSLEMLKSGLAEVYNSAGAEYGSLKETFERAEASAKSV